MKKEEVSAKMLGSEKKCCRVRAIANCGERSDTNIVSISLDSLVASRLKFMEFSPYCPLKFGHAEYSLLTILVSFGKISALVLVQSEKQNHFELWRRGFIRGNRPDQL